MLREGKGNLRLVIPGNPGNHIKSKVKFKILFIFMPWPAIRKTANNDSISRLNSRPKLPFPGNEEHTIKIKVGCFFHNYLGPKRMEAISSIIFHNHCNHGWCKKLFEGTLLPYPVPDHTMQLHSKTILSSQTGASKLFCIGFSLFWSQCRTWGSFQLFGDGNRHWRESQSREKNRE